MSGKGVGNERREAGWNYEMKTSKKRMTIGAWEKYHMIPGQQRGMHSTTKKPEYTRHSQANKTGCYKQQNRPILEEAPLFCDGYWRNCNRDLTENTAS